MKKFISLLTAMVIALGAFAGCSNTATSSQTTNENIEKLKVVATIYPQYDWAKEIIGDNDNIELTLLLDSGADLHSYQATAKDIITISDCDLFIYVGGESDNWVDEVLANANNKDMQVINLMETLGDDVKAEEMVEGMQESAHSHDHEHEDENHEHEDENHEHEDENHEHEDENHEHEDENHEHEDENHDHEDENHEHGVENDEHVWLSLDNAKVISNAIAESLAVIDTDNADSYKSNASAYIATLDSLDEQYEEVVESAKHDTILMADRFPFRYLVDEYDIDYYAAFIGCSAETEASFETITFLATKLDELGLSKVLTIDGSDGKIANTVINASKNKDQEVLVLDSMQSVDKTRIANGETYVSIMQSNLDVLKNALN